ncbi:hypothetical protein KJ877_00665 [bacterium]|nr:hypothetical protein [bacterium]MBU1989539.1 hypothetical protein [bacterium]
MKKIIVSVAVAAIALSTTASALEDIKVNGQAKVWYETDNANSSVNGEMFDNTQSSAEVVFKLGMTGKQGDVGFGTSIYQTSTMGLEGTLVGATRTNTTNLQGDGEMFVGEAYITAPIAPKTVLKFGKQELDTPLAFTERWNAVPNTFNAAVAINSSVDNVTLIGAYVGQDSSASWKVDGEVDQQYFGGAFALAALYSADGVGANFWAYHINNVGSTGLAWLTGGASGVSVDAAWVDAGMKVADINLKGYGAFVTHDGSGAKETTALAASADMDVQGWNLFAAVSGVSTGDLPVANTATNFKKTKLPTAGVYTDGQYVGQPGATAIKIKAAGKVADTGVALQVVNNEDRNNNDAKDTTEIDLILSQKVGVVDLKGIIMHRMFADSATEDAAGGQHVRVIASINF